MIYQLFFMSIKFRCPFAYNLCIKTPSKALSILHAVRSSLHHTTLRSCVSDRRPGHDFLWWQFSVKVTPLVNRPTTRSKRLHLFAGGIHFSFWVVDCSIHNHKRTAVSPFFGVQRRLLQSFFTLPSIK